ncbi:helix-turn-helix transcriptional regulator [Microtetraspora sp. NBRC 16547]|uniref:helix-turn-helix domain-containing protein n=1 Tax=Microtetraspora sp. NBRC 16547 TaxID=3030993 RepID=UPI00249FDB04|nr:helix-turn-helix transcriptional regulator [Microtetraspora sp. NBRC 16547]GLW98886.1 transcriptional regulator [Microtetraspora sp. NBRC 16547]
MAAEPSEDRGLDRSVGQRVRALRLRKGLGLRACAELCGRTEEWLRQVERGEQRLDKLSTLVSLAGVLGVRDLGLIVEERLQGMTCVVSDGSRLRHEAVPAIRKVISMPIYPIETISEVPAKIESMRRRLTMAWSMWHMSARPYTALGGVAPGLLTDALALHRTAEPKERRKTWAILAETFQLAQRFLYCVGEPELAARAADRALLAAEETDDRLLMALSAWTSTMAALGRSEIEEARDVAECAVHHLEPELSSSKAALSVWGSLHLFTAIAYAKSRRPADAWRHWDRARDAAIALGAAHHNPLTMFGQANVGIYAVAIEVETGRSGAAVDRAKAIEVSTIPSSNRRAQHLLDLARGQLRHRDSDGALASLRLSETHSAETLMFSLPAKQTVIEMIEASRRPSPTLLDLAVRARVIA